MADPASPEGGAPQDAAPDASADTPMDAGAPVLRVLTQFIKDLSFENPGALSGNPGGPSPEIELGIDVRVEPGPAQDRIFSVDLRLSARAKRQEAIVFIADLTYTGVFQLGALPQGDVEPILLIECPRLLFPFARRILAEVSRDGGHPPLIIDPIDFVGLYRRQHAQRAAGAGAEGASAGEQQA